MSKIPELLIATHNQGKAAEFELLLAPYVGKIISAKQKKLPEPEESEKTFAGNAKLKAIAGAKATGLLTLADDSGFGLIAFDGKPGVQSARFAKTKTGFDYDGAANKLMEKLEPDETRAAFFTCVLALAKPSGAAYLVEGRCDGTFIYPGRGDQGFGYDPFFRPEGEAQSFGEMSQLQKHPLSHRGKAIAKLLKFLESNDGRSFVGLPPKA